MDYELTSFDNILYKCLFSNDHIALQDNLWDLNDFIKEDNIKLVILSYDFYHRSLTFNIYYKNEYVGKMNIRCTCIYFFEYDNKHIDEMIEIFKEYSEFTIRN